jgi:uncharacterized phiE125 gp8 family phage protein
MIRVVTPPAAYPCTLAEAKEWCRVRNGDTSQDNTLTVLIATMTAYAEHLTGRAFVQRTLEQSLEWFGNDVSNYQPGASSMGSTIALPFPPLLGIEAIAYTDLNAAAQEVLLETYEVDTTTEPGRVRPVFGSVWPVAGRVFNPVRIRYIAGYRPTASPTDLTDNSYLPAPLRTWLAARICTLYDNRSQVIIERATVDTIPRDFVDALLDPLTVGTRLF